MENYKGPEHFYAEFCLQTKYELAPKSFVHLKDSDQL